MFYSMRGGYMDPSTPLGPFKYNFFSKILLYAKRKKEKCVYIFAYCSNIWKYLTMAVMHTSLSINIIFWYRLIVNFLVV